MHFLLEHRSHSALWEFGCTAQWFDICRNYEMGFPGVSVVKTLPASAEHVRLSLIPGLGEPGRRGSSKLQYSCLENPQTERPLGYSPQHHKNSEATQHTRTQIRILKRDRTLYYTSIHTQSYYSVIDHIPYSVYLPTVSYLHTTGGLCLSIPIT